MERPDLHNFVRDTDATQKCRLPVMAVLYGGPTLDPRITAVRMAADQDMVEEFPRLDQEPIYTLECPTSSIDSHSKTW